MFHALAILLCTVPQPTPSSFRIEVEAPKNASYVLYLDGKKIEANKTWVTQPLLTTFQGTVKIVWIGYDDKPVDKAFTIKLVPGLHHRYVITGPNAAPTKLG